MGQGWPGEGRETLAGGGSRSPWVVRAAACGQGKRGSTRPTATRNPTSAWILFTEPLVNYTKIHPWIL